MDENYNLLPHGVNFQDAIFPESPENHRMFVSFFQFSNCTSGTDPQLYTPDWDVQEDYRLLCATVQKALLDEEELVKTLSQKVRILEKANGHLREKVKKLKRSVRQAKMEGKREVMLAKQLLNKQRILPRGDPKLDSNKQIFGKPTKKATGNKLQ